jgi:hypothetical protein
MANTTTKKNIQEYLYNNTIILKPGANTIELSVITAQGTVTTDKRTINYSAPVRPILAWQNPVANTSEVNQASVDIRMNIKSADDLNNLTVYLNGKALDNINLQNSIRKENEEYVLGNTVVLKPGDNSLYVSAGNIAGLTTSETRNIKYTVLSIPVIAWSNPETAVSSLATPAITLTANITSTTELKDLKIYQNENPLPVNPAISTTDKQQGVYHIEQVVNLSQGENSIYIVAGNKAGNAKSETRSISYTAPVAPVITWVAPSKPVSEISLPAAEIRASVKSPEKLQSVVVYVNGVGSEEVNRIVPTGTPGEYLFKKTINLQPADNTLYLSAKNSAGSVRSEDRLLRNPPPSKPVITWAIPSVASTTVNTDMLVIEACIQTSSPLKETQIYVNNIPWASQTFFPDLQQGDCSFRYTNSVLLKEGDNNIIINAINAAGSQMSERRTIRFQKGITERRLALVIGNAKYANSAELKNPINDANLMDSTLKNLDFEVIKCLNAGLNEMKEAIKQFSEKLPAYNVALFYYAGHGMQVDGENYLLPIDAKLEKESDCQWYAVRVNDVVRQFEKVPENVNIIILDACRDNPYKSWSRGAPQGFKMLNTVSGTFVSFATGEGTTAADGEGPNGTFTEELAKQMTIPQSIYNVFVNTRAQVLKKTNNRQQPEERNKLTGDFWFKR